MTEAPMIVGRPALLVVDMQAGAAGTESGIPRMGGFADRVTRVRDLVDRFRMDGNPVLFIREQHRGTLIDFGRELDGLEQVHCLEGDPGTAIAAELGVRDDDILIPKRRYSAFFATDLDLVLRGLGVQTVLLVGELTDVCIHYTFVDAHQHDYFARVVEDCCGGSSRPAHDAALAAMAYLQLGARLLSRDLLASPTDQITATVNRCEAST